MAKPTFLGRIILQLVIVVFAVSVIAMFEPLTISSMEGLIAAAAVLGLIWLEGQFGLFSDPLANCISKRIPPEKLQASSIIKFLFKC